uniref:Uncharacterized protein n=2 Tax=Micrurus TaxID=8634 RepID=A0A2D4H494_MICCO
MHPPPTVVFILLFFGSLGTPDRNPMDCTKLEVPGDTEISTYKTRNEFFGKELCSFILQNSYCLIQYWKHGSWLSAINCPLCRQKVFFLYTCSEYQPDKKSKQTFYDIRTYNKRFSGHPQSFIDHLYDMPLLLLVILRGIFTLAALVWIFLFRVVICFFGTIMCSTCPLEGMPEPLCGILQTADNLAVMLLLLISFISICPQMESQGANRTISRE